MIQEPSVGDLSIVLQLLHNNGIAVTNAKSAYQELEQYRGNPSFCVALSRIFGSGQCSDLGVVSPPGAWPQYRHLAGITLKNSIEHAHQSLGEGAVSVAAKTSVDVLQRATTPSLVRTSAQIIVKITSIAGLGWWDATFGVSGYLPALLIGQQSLMGSSSSMQILGALYCIQYLLEDVPKQLGESSAYIVERVVNCVVMSHADPAVRKVAFRVATHPYEIGAILDWNVDVLSPMQVGLCTASVHLVRATSFIAHTDGRDPVIMILALRSMLLMLDYLEYFTPVMPTEEFNKVVISWVGTAVWHVEHSNADKEATAAAAELLSGIAENYDRTGGEGPIIAFVPHVVQRFATLLPALILHSVLSDEEVAAVAESDHYSKRDQSAVKVRHQGSAIEEDDTMDDDEAAMTLRRACSRCVENCCKLSQETAFPLILHAASTGWVHPDWRHREVALLVFGAAVDGCYGLLLQTLPAVAPQLIELAQKVDEHVCVVSMALWAIQRIAKWLLTDGDAHLVGCVQVCIDRLCSESKRIQSAAATAINAFYTAAFSLLAVEKMQTTLTSLVRALHTCLPVYHTGNLSQLCLIALNVLPSLALDAQVQNLAGPFFADRDQRMARFVSSYTACYINGDSTALVDKDVFSVDQILIASHMRLPAAGSAIPQLNTWVEVLKDVVSRNAFDDADLLYNTLYTCCNYVKSCDTASLQQWSAATQSQLALSSCSILSLCKHSLVRSAALMLLYVLLSVLQGAALPDSAVVPLLQILTPIVDEEDSPSAISDTARVIVALFKFSPSTPQSQQAVYAVWRKLRSDCFGDSLLYYTSMAINVVMAIEASPEIFARNIDFKVIFEILKQSPNSYEKSAATTGIAAGVLLVPPQNFIGFVHELLRFAFSWQQSAIEFPGTLDALSAMLHRAKEVAAQPMLEQLNSLNSAFQQQFLETYRLQ